jgi:hypothetical protein
MGMLQTPKGPALELASQGSCQTLMRAEFMYKCLFWLHLVYRRAAQVRRARARLIAYKEIYLLLE